MNYQDPGPAPVQSAAQGGRLRPATRRVFMLTAVAALAILAVMVALQFYRDADARARLAANRPQPLPVSYETAQPAPLPQSLNAIGTIAAINRATISAEVGGAVTRVAYEPGARVRQGDLLVQLNDAAEQADLTSFRAQARLAQVALQRSKDLSQRGAAAKAQLDQMQSEAEVAAAGIARAEAAIAKKAIRAPFDGEIGMNMVDPGEYVSPGQAMAVLSDSSRLYIHFSLPEHVRPQLKVGQSVEIGVDAFPQERFTATLAVIDPEVDTATRAVRLHAVADNPDSKLVPGMFANVRLVLPEAENVLTVPETAISYAMSGNSLFIAEPGPPGPDGKPMFTVRKVGVETGASAGGRIIVSKGLAPGDRVVTTGLTKIFEGSPVILKEGTALEMPAALPRQ